MITKPILTNSVYVYSDPRFADAAIEKEVLDVVNEDYDMSEQLSWLKVIIEDSIGLETHIKSVIYWEVEKGDSLNNLVNSLDELGFYIFGVIKQLGDEYTIYAITNNFYAFKEITNSIGADIEDNSDKMRILSKLMEPNYAIVIKDKFTNFKSTTYLNCSKATIYKGLHINIKNHIVNSAEKLGLDTSGSLSTILKFPMVITEPIVFIDCIFEETEELRIINTEAKFINCRFGNNLKRVYFRYTEDTDADTDIDTGVRVLGDINGKNDLDLTNEDYKGITIDNIKVDRKYALKHKGAYGKIILASNDTTNTNSIIKPYKDLKSIISLLSTSTSLEIGGKEVQGIQIDGIEVSDRLIGGAM